MVQYIKSIKIALRDLLRTVQVEDGATDEEVSFWLISMTTRAGQRNCTCNLNAFSHV